MNEKTDEQLLAEANALDAAYASAEIHDLRFQNKFLLEVLGNLVAQVYEGVSHDAGSKELWTAVETAEEALGYHDITDERDYG